ncbi:MAG: hypothetical protein JWP42_3099 [Pseudomonas sp.]|nr:hypothetical protein [Pseudomonas sp.]
MATKPFINVSAYQQAAPILSPRFGMLHTPSPIGSLHAPVIDTPTPHHRAEATAPA